MKSSSLSFAPLTTLILSLAFLLSACARPDPSVQLKPLIDKYVAAWNTGDFAGLEDVVSQDFELRMTPRFEPVRGIDSLKHAIAYWRTAYPDFTIEVNEIMFTSDRITARWTIRATNTGPGALPPTGKSIVVPGMSLFHVADGKIKDEWIAGNNLSWMQQLGFRLVPPE